MSLRIAENGKKGHCATSFHYQKILIKKKKNYEDIYKYIYKKVINGNCTDQPLLLN